jgi:Tol biopolymer transport system component
VTYTSTATGGSTIRRRLADGSGAEEAGAAASPYLLFVSHWSPDGRSILFWSAEEGLFKLTPADGRVVPLPQTRPGESEPRVSPDGRWIAYVSNESGRNEVYIRPLLGGAKVVISTQGGVWPYWRRDGKELYYVAPDKTLTAVSIQTTEPVEVGKPKPLFQVTTGGRSPYSTIDGERFLVRVSDDPSSALTWVWNWPAVLKK